MAIQVLMAYDFSFSDSLYFWGQNRLGSLLPMVSIPLIKIGIPPIWAVSIILYAFVVGAWLLLKPLLKNKTSQFALLAFFLFQPFVFKESLMAGHPYVPQFFIVAWVVNILYHHANNIVKKVPQLILLLGIGFWVSEMILAIILSLFIWFWVNRKSNSLKNQIINTSLIKALQIGISLISVVILILILKNNSPSSSHYHQTFNSPQQVIDVFLAVYNGLINTLFSSLRIFETLLAWVWLIPIFGVLFYWKQVKRNSITFFVLLSSITIFVMLLSSYWVYKNNIPFRYFSLFYQLLGFFTLLFYDRQKKLNQFSIIFLLIPIFSVAGILADINRGDHFVKNRPNHTQSINIIKGSKKTILGDFWNSYVYAAYNPDKVIALPHDKDFNRNYRYSAHAFDNDSILVFGKNWLNGYPDTLIQYGERLIKRGEHLSYNGTIGIYSPLETHSLDYRFFKHNGSIVNDSIEGEVLILKASTESYDRVLWGSNKYLGVGKYEITFRVKPDKNNTPLKLRFNINERIKRQSLIDETIKSEEYSKTGFTNYIFEIEIKNRDCLNFDIYLPQGGSIYFKSITITKQSDN